MVHTVLIADDHPILLSGLSALIDGHPDFRVVATAADGLSALEGIGRLKPEIAVLDLNMPNMSGLDILSRVRIDHPNTRVVMLVAAASDEEIHAIVKGGASGLLFKEAAPQVLTEALLAVTRGNVWLPEGTTQIVDRETEQQQIWRERLDSLTSREVEIARLADMGRSNKEIAYLLGLSQGTVKVHLNNVFRKLGVATRRELRKRAGGSLPADARAS